MEKNEPVTVELKSSQTEYLDKMVEKYGLPDRSKALRCLIAMVMSDAEQERSAFQEIRCLNC